MSDRDEPPIYSPPSIKQRAFSGCHRHGRFDYYCHACLVATVATLCGILDNEGTPAPLSWHVPRACSGPNIAQANDRSEPGDA